MSIAQATVMGGNVINVAKGIGLNVNFSETIPIKSIRHTLPSSPIC